MTYVEIVAALFGALSVYFYIVRNHWSWPVGLVQVVLYIGVFEQAKLYADMLLHIVYAGLQLYGWWAWYQSSKRQATSPVGSSLGQDDSLEICVLGMKGNFACIVVSLAMTTVYSLLLGRYTDASSPLPDSCIAAFSLTAQMLLAWRYVDNWRYWIFVDLVAIGLFAFKELYITSILYALFLVMAIVGDRAWRSILLEQKGKEAAVT
jgi:nicotinamide mononucleotide transporter